jgi:hypothetical protein
MRGVTDDDERPRRPRVLERVRERLLDNPEGGQVDAGGQLGGLALDAKLDGESCSAQRRWRWGISRRA